MSARSAKSPYRTSVSKTPSAVIPTDTAVEAEGGDGDSTGADGDDDEEEDEDENEAFAEKNNSDSDLAVSECSVLPGASYRIRH